MTSEIIQVPNSPSRSPSIGQSISISLTDRKTISVGRAMLTAIPDLLRGEVYYNCIKNTFEFISDISKLIATKLNNILINVVKCAVSLFFLAGYLLPIITVIPVIVVAVCFPKEIIFIFKDIEAELCNILKSCFEILLNFIPFCASDLKWEDANFSPQIEVVSYFGEPEKTIPVEKQEDSIRIIDAAMRSALSESI